jgi:hypothetical protein
MFSSIIFTFYSHLLKVNGRDKILTKNLNKNINEIFNNIMQIPSLRKHNT